MSIRQKLFGKIEKTTAGYRIVVRHSVRILYHNCTRRAHVNACIRAGMPVMCGSLPHVKKAEWRENQSLSGDVLTKINSRD